MINTYRIITEQGELDTFGGESISLNYSIDDIFDLNKRNTSWTKTIDLPGTAINNKYFKHLYDVNIDNISFNVTKRIAASIQIGTNDVLKGYMQLMNIVVKNKEITYQISIAGTLKNIISELSEFNLSDLDLSKYNHVRNQANIISSWDYDIYVNSGLTSYNTPGEGYVYPYIINGNSSDVWSNIYTYDMFPAVYTKTVIDLLFERIGITYTSEFFNSDYFKMTILPYIGSKLQMTDEQKEQRTVRAGITSSSGLFITPPRQNNTSWYYTSMNNYLFQLDRESGTVDDVTGELTFTDDLNQWNSLDLYTCQNTGFYDIAFNGNLFAVYTHSGGSNVQWNANSLEYEYKLRLLKVNGSVINLVSSGGLLITPSNGFSHASPWYDTANPLEFTMNASDVMLEVGDKLQVFVGHRHPGNVNWSGIDSKISSRLWLDQVTDGSFTKFIVTPSSNDLLSTTMIDMNQILDSSKRANEFFMDIVKMFNLVVSDNPNKINDVIIEPRDDFFKSKQKVFNWDEEKKLDNDSDVIITPMSELDSNSYKYTYTEDSDFYNEEYTDETDRVYGDFEVKVDNDFSNKTNELKIGFAPTPDGQQFIDSRVAPFFMTMADDKMKPKKVKQRILFYNGTIDLYSGSTMTIKDYPSQTSYTTVTRYPYVGMWDHPTNPQYDLGFGRTDKIYYGTSVYPNQNLFEKFHKQTLMNVVDLNAKILECTVLLTPKDIAQFDFRDIIFLLGSYWRVNKIKDYNPVQTDRLTTVILYKIIDLNILSLYQVEVPTSNQSCPTDMVSKKQKDGIVIVSASGKVVTADCCKQVGGNFIDGVCRVKRKIGPEVQKYTISSGLGVVPTSDPTGPVILNANNTSRNTLGVSTFGSGNYVPDGASPGFIVGSNNTIGVGVTGSVVIGDGISASEDNTVYIGGIKIDQSGNILKTGIVIIDGGKNEVFNFNKTNPTEIIDGTVNSVRNPGGSSYARPIIDNTDPV